MFRRIINLNDSDWVFGRVPSKPIDCEDVYDPDRVVEWLPGTVPGNVRSDLLALGRIPDPFYGMDNEKSQWVDDWDWWYRREVGLELEKGERAFLVFEGIDYISAVYLDSVELGRHEGMFSRQVYEITELVNGKKSKLGGHPPNPPAGEGPCTYNLVVQVRIWGSASLPTPQLSLWDKLWAQLVSVLFRGSEVFPDRIATVKCQMGFGWDFAPRLRTMGIWDDVYIIITRSVFIEDVFVRYEGQQEAEPAKVRLHLDLDADRAQEVKALVIVRGRNFELGEELRFVFDLSLVKGPQITEVEFAIEAPGLWEPWDRGRPDLYELEIQLLPSASSTPLDSLTTTFGLRTIEMAPNPEAPPEAESWTFLINGRREFIRGGNWVPLDALPGQARREDYAPLIDLACEAHINMLRVWGGGLREKRAFYDLCDERGILVWQDFPFVCVFLGNYPRHEAFLRLARRECTAIVRRLRNHPSLVLWCGGNEYSAQRNATLVGTLRAVAMDEDGTRPFRATSPGPGDVHSWRVWWGKANFRDYREEQAQFISEFGLQAAPDATSLQEFIPPEDLWPPGETWRYHRADLERLNRYARPFRQGHLVSAVRRLISRGPSSSESLKELTAFVSASQQAQAFGLQVAIEHFRRRKYKTGGAMFWQFNEPWPAICWSVVDYHCRPKLAYQRLKRLYNPVLISLDYPLVRYRAGDLFQAQVWAINDLLESFDGCRLRVTLDGEEILSSTLSLPPDSCQGVGAVEQVLKGDGGCLKVELSHAGRLISSNEYDLGYYDPAEMSWLDAFYSWLLDRAVR